jgi:hypothetical protein
MIEFLERECQRAAIALNVAEANHQAWAARLLAAYDGITEKRDAALKVKQDKTEIIQEPTLKWRNMEVFAWWGQHDGWRLVAKHARIPFDLSEKELFKRYEIWPHLRVVMIYSNNTTDILQAGYAQ